MNSSRPLFVLFIPAVFHRLKGSGYNVVLFNYEVYQLQVVNRYIDEGVAELVPGVLFIDEVILR